MGKINVLSSHVADLIAAGEVVENPASVAKELCENSVDSGAAAITVEIENGGISYIRVTDDGCGMSEEDAKTAFLRHATSKIKDADDLERIATFGFRGEALAAISAVSKIDLITKERGADFGTAIRAEAGKVIRSGESGCPEGTTIIIRDLFYNTPARMRFLRKDSSEAAAVESVVRATAISHPEVSVKMLRDGREVFHTPGDSSLKSCIYALFGRGFSENMREVKIEERGITVSGFTCTPTAARGNRAMQFFFVNGRPIRSKMLAASLDTAYKERIMKGKFPMCVLKIDLPLSQVDVNVHPAKTEVKFSRERDVFDAVYYGVKSALDRDMRELPKVAHKTSAVDNVTENQQKIEQNALKTEAPKPSAIPSVKKEETKKEAPLPFFAPVKHDFPSFMGSSMAQYEVKKRSEAKAVEIKPEIEPEAKAEIKPEVKEEVKPEVYAGTKEAPPQVEEKAEINLRYIGEALNTYIIVEQGESVILIDKHAAHERIIFEELKKSYGKPETQLLLAPQLVELDVRGAAALLENKEEVLALGFDIDEFGDGSVAVSAVPCGIDAGDAVPILESLSERLLSGARLENPDVLSEVLYSVACKAAIKAGQKNDERELSALAKRVLGSDDIRYCPHGRPVMIEYKKSELERQFKRIV